MHEVSFKVDAGDFLCVFGENGAGKSTLIKTILGLMDPISGKIAYDGILQREIGYLPQQTEVQKNFPASVREIVRSGCLNQVGFRPFLSAQEKSRVEITINRLGIGSLAPKSFRNLSGGQQRRVLLARALVATGKLIVLDEPAAGLDPKATAELYDLIADLNKKDGITVIMVSHDLRAAVTYATHILHLAHHPLFFGTKEEYMSSEIGKAFLSLGGHA